uniref:Terpineol synthase, chloroplastic n=1 Tax=Nicotiana alata TaxID=4087 RepID=TER_NICAL|nr:RecName: Full=Terpineol synthase, chloroplastic; AltName: Full=1,8-cineol synthase, chloroplastic; AltName: Full=Beta-myrcene synthase; AltName: Full=Limonene synthase; AltName: Full=Sabinene synthase; Flags: Precursor [Nicotiana alata]AFB82540.1 plastid monoterpene synthase [Nicotiana alata]
MNTEPSPNHYSAISSSDQNLTRRSGNYQPTMWDFEYIQSIHNDYAGDKYMKRFNELKEEMKKMIMAEGSQELEKLELIDNLQRLGVSYHFKHEIMQILSSIKQHSTPADSLYATALKFRLLREHGFHISQEIFDGLSETHTKDTKGMLYLYEASFLATEGESELEQAWTEKHLREYLKNKNIDQNVAKLVHRALELPLHWRMLRLEARWFISFYKKRQDMIPLLLELAILDFNIVQAAHIQDLKYVARWWKETGLAENLPFARDRLVENFFWTIGVNFLPQYGYFRRIETKVNALVTTIDDVYDVFGTLDELQCFTDAIQRWNTDELDNLPDNMKMCYFALDDFINEVACDALIVPYLRNAWTDLCKSYLIEAKWYFSKYIPTMEEYMDNAWISISAPVILVHAYFLIANPVNKEALHYLRNYHDIIRWSALILRLANDLGTSSDELKRGDVPKSIQCYMNEKKVSEEEARQHIRLLISETWKKLNEAHNVAAHPFPKMFVKSAMNLARMAQCMYQHGDGHGGQNSETQNRIMALLFESIPPA